MMNTYFKLLFLTTLSLNIQGCGPDVKEQSTVKIIGGRPTIEGELPAVVAILRNKIPFCSGTLISSSLVLTAGHCVEKFLQKNDRDLSEIEVFFGNNSNQAESGKLVKVLRAGIHPSFWRDHLSAMDFALLEIEEVLDVEPMEFLLDRTIIGSMVDTKKQTVISGFGLTQNNPEKDTVTNSFFGVKNIASPLIQGSKGDEFFVGDSQMDACSGDSGGPVFVQANPRKIKLISVSSRGPFPCARDYNPGISTLAAAGICWFNDFSTHKVSYWAESCAEEHKGFSPSPQLLARLESGDKSLRLGGYNIQDITWIAKGKELSNIKLAWNRIKDLSPLLELTKLEKLDIRGNEIEDLTVIEKLRSKNVEIIGLNSQKFNLANTEFSKLNALGISAGPEIRSTILALRTVLTSGPASRKSLDLSTRIHLNLSNREVKSLKPLSGLENLENLILSKNPKLTDLDILKNLPRLHYLDVSGFSGSAEANAVLEELKAKGVTVVGF